MNENETFENVALTDDNMIPVILATNGYPDMDQIPVENVSTKATEYVKFNELDSETKLKLLTTSVTDYLNEDEIEFLSTVRANNVSIDDLIGNVATYKANEYIKDYTMQQVDGDSLTDEQVYAAYLKDLFPDIDDETLIQDVLKDKSESETKFNAVVNKTRSEIKNLQDELKAEQQELARISEDRELEASVKILEDYSNNTTHILNTFELENSDKTEILDAILKKDSDGLTKLQKELAKPENLFLAAWVISKGQIGINMLLEESMNNENKINPPTTVIIDENNTKNQDSSQIIEVFKKNNNLYK